MESTKRRKKTIEGINKSQKQQYKRKVIKNKTMIAIFLCLHIKIVIIPSHLKGI